MPKTTDLPNQSAANEMMPVLFVGHGNPMNALEDNPFSRAWTEMGKTLPRPDAILCISAHWETEGSRVTAMERPQTIHDFGGFPQALYDVRYPAPGSPGLASDLARSIKKAKILPDEEWGLDHGTWSVLSRMFPKADVPVVQLSLDATRAPEFHYALGEELRALRAHGVLILGSGNLVHNLPLAVYQDTAFDWALEFDETIRRLIVAGDHRAIVRYPDFGKIGRLAIPTNEHYLPLLYALAAGEKDEPVRFFAEGVTMGSVSMRSLRIG